MKQPQKTKPSDDFALFKWRWLDRVATDPKLPPAASRIAILIAGRYLNRQSGEAWPGVETLAAELSIKAPNTIRSTIKAMEARGHLNVEWSQGGKKQTNHYWPLLDGIPFKKLKGIGSSNPSKNCGDTLQIQDAKPLKDLKGNPLKEPIEEPRQALRAPAKDGHIAVNGRDARRGASPDPVDGYKVGDTIDVPGLGSGAISRVSARDKLGRIHIEVPLQYGIADADAIVPVDPAGNICTDQVWWSDEEPERTSRIAWPDPVLTPAPAKNSRKGKTDAA